MSDNRSLNDWTEFGAANLTVPHVDELGPRRVRTGVLGPDGNEITRDEKKPQIGFVHAADLERQKHKQS